MTIIDFEIVIYCAFIKKSVHTDTMFSYSTSRRKQNKKKKSIKIQALQVGHVLAELTLWKKKKINVFFLYFNCGNLKLASVDDFYGAFALYYLVLVKMLI